MNKSEKYAIKCMYVLNVSDCSKTKTREGIEREREKGKGGLEGKRERERGRKEERDKTLDKALLKKVGRWKAHWRILGNSVCLCCITFPVQTLWERTKIKTKRRGNKARICKEKFFTLNEKQIFEQMETFFYVSSLAASRHRSFLSIAQNASFGFHPWKTC